MCAKLFYFMSGVDWAEGRLLLIKIIIKSTSLTKNCGVLGWKGRIFIGKMYKKSRRNGVGVGRDGFFSSANLLTGRKKRGIM